MIKQIQESAMNRLSENQQIAGSALIALVGGFLIAFVFAHIERSFIIWILAVICCGIALGGIDTFSYGTLLRRVLFPSVILTFTPIFFFYFLGAIVFIQNPLTPKISLSWGDILLYPFEPSVIVVVVILWVTSTVATVIFIGISLLAKREIVSSAKLIETLGSGRIEGIRKIVLAIAGVVSAVLFLLTALQK
jgi:hypothetical protein